MSESKQIVVTGKQLSISLGSLAALLTFATLVHGKWVMPTILQETRTQTEELIRSHESRPHLDAVSRREFKAYSDRLLELATKEQVRAIEKQLLDISGRIREIETGKMKGK